MFSVISFHSSCSFNMVEYTAYMFLKMKVRVCCARSLIRGFVSGEGIFSSCSFVRFHAMVAKLTYYLHLSNTKCAKIFALSPIDVLHLQSSP